MKTQTGYIKRNGFTLNYFREGSGELMLVIGSRHFYQRLFSPALRKNLDIVFADHRGFSEGHSPLSDPEHQYALEEIIEDIEALRKELGWEKFWLAGHSAHGYMALEYSKKYIDHLNGLVLISMSTSLSTENHALADLHFDTLAEQERITAFRANMENLDSVQQAEPDLAFVHMNLALSPKSWRNLETDASQLWQDVKPNMPAIDYLWGTVFKHIDISPGLDDLYIPVFLALGKFDFLVGSHDQWKAIAKILPDLTMEIFEESAHNPPYEEEAKFNKKLLDWMELYK